MVETADIQEDIGFPKGFPEGFEVITDFLTLAPEEPQGGIDLKNVQLLPGDMIAFAQPASREENIDAVFATVSPDYDAKVKDTIPVLIDDNPWKFELFDEITRIVPLGEQTKDTPISFPFVFAVARKMVT